MGEVQALVDRLYAALRHEKSCKCGECSGGLNAVDQLAAAVRAGGEAAAALRALAWTTEDGLCWCPDGWFDLDEVGYQEHGFGDHSEGCVAAREALASLDTAEEQTP